MNRQPHPIHPLPDRAGLQHDHVHLRPRQPPGNVQWPDRAGPLPLRRQRLLTEGGRTYSYDTANRLVSYATGDPPNITFTYNGLGDRLTQTTGGQETPYTLDLAAGLTQVLHDDTHTYLYGNMRLAQHTSTTTEYFLPDALGSVRQLVDETGTLTLAQAYQPLPFAQGRLYGETLHSSGSGASPYGFAGEYTDRQTGLQYLRARYYAPGVGRFLTKDGWAGDVMRPMSLNGWVYGYANPLRYTDPSGNIPCELLPREDQAGCQGGAGGGGTNPQPPLPPMGLPVCTPRLIAMGEPCIPIPCWLLPGPGGGTPGTQLPPLPSPEEVPNPEGRPKNIQKAIGEYEIIRSELFEKYLWDYIDTSGKINDVVLIGMIISGEFGDLKNTTGRFQGYLAGLAAVSNQYHSTHATVNIQCGGSCTLAEQLGWLSDVEAWFGRGGTGGRIRNQKLYLPDTPNGWKMYYPDALRARNGCTGNYCTAWMWGDIQADDPVLSTASNGDYYYKVGSLWHKAIYDAPSVYYAGGTWIVWEWPGVEKVP